MEIEVVTRSGKELSRFQLPEKTLVGEFKQKFATKYPKWPKSRQRFTVGQPRGPVLDDDEQLLSHYLNSYRKLVFRDLGPQLSWRLVYIIEYLGPLIICPALYFFPEVFYGQPATRSTHQFVCLLMLLGHFIKRELETVFVHRFSSATMPFNNVFVNSGYYWCMNGLLISYFQFHPLYTVPSYSNLFKTLLLIGFGFSQLMNFFCHMVLRNLRKPGTKERGIPRGYGFDQVSCANYFWETCLWLCFAVYSNCLTSYLFLLATVVTLKGWSMKRHKRYLKEFDGKEGRPLYPDNRTSYLPFII